MVKDGPAQGKHMRILTQKMEAMVSNFFELRASCVDSGGALGNCFPPPHHCLLTMFLSRVALAWRDPLSAAGAPLMRSSACTQIQTRHFFAHRRVSEAFLHYICAHLLSGLALEHHGHLFLMFMYHIPYMYANHQSCPGTRNICA